jgi:hypothetical protein
MLTKMNRIAALFFVLLVATSPSSGVQSDSSDSPVIPPRKSSRVATGSNGWSHYVSQKAIRRGPLGSPQSIDVTGNWIDSFGYPWMLTQDKSGDISGSVDYSSIPCPDPVWPVTGSVTGESQFSITATNPDGGDDVCVSYVTYDMTISSDGNSASGTWQDPDGSGNVSMQRTV